MASRRCSKCDIDYPTDEEICHVCENETWESRDDYDPEWPDRVEMLIRRKAIANLEGLPDADIKILTHRGRQWVVEELLEGEGYICQSLGIVKINGDFYELAGRRDGEIPAWWIELIKWEDEFKDLLTLSADEYRKVLERRGSL